MKKDIPCNCHLSESHCRYSNIRQSGGQLLEQLLEIITSNYYDYYY